MDDVIELPKVEKYIKQEKYKNLDLWVKFIKNPEVFEMLKKENKDKELQKTMDTIENWYNQWIAERNISLSNLFILNKKITVISIDIF